MPTIAELDVQIAELEGQIATAMQAGGGLPDYSAFYKSPGYDFRLQEGIRAIDRSASAKGKLMSGGLQRELTRYGQGVASSEFNTYADRLASMAGIGQTATRSTGALGSAAAGQGRAISYDIGESIMAGGQAQASGYVGSSNAMQRGYEGAIDAFTNWGQPTQNTGSGGTNSLLNNLFRW